MTQPKRIGVLTSGGDCPGLNAVIRSVVKCASRKGWEVYGIPYGTDGFLSVQDGSCSVEDLRLKEHGYDIPGVLHGLDVLQFLSGSILGSISKGDPRQPGVKEQILAGYSKLGLDALVVIGGDGSLDIIYSLAEAGNWKLVAVPKTIDNDVPFTERAVGFGTAVDTVTDALYNLTFTAASHDRVMVVQVMGRDAGHLALHSGIAAGADVILIPELVPQLSQDVIQALCERLAMIRKDGRKFALVVVAEGVHGVDAKPDKYIGDRLAELIKHRSQELCNSGEHEFCQLNQVDTRSTTLGHIQRAGPPSSFDRLLGIAFGKKAIDLIEAEDYNQLVVWKSGGVQTRPLSEVIPILRRCHADGCCPSPVAPDDYLVKVAHSLGIYVGNGNW